MIFLLFILIWLPMVLPEIFIWFKNREEVDGVSMEWVLSEIDEHGNMPIDGDDVGVGR